MSEQDGDAREQRLNEIVADYFAAVDAGRAGAPSEYIARFPEFRSDLERFFAAQSAVVPITTTVARAATVLPAGKSFAGYLILRELGRGGVGVVYKARQFSPDRIVALKVILAGRAATATERARFRLDAEAASRLDHPNVVPVYEVGEQEGRPFFTMRYLEGGDLRSHLPRLTTDPRAAAVLLCQLGEAVHHAHQRGVLHRDLKPANVLLDGTGRPYLTDFGLARDMATGEGVTKTGELIGTLEYMAPEQAEGGRATVTVATDVHGLGAVLYSTLTGYAPFSAKTVAEVLDRVRNADPIPPRRLNTSVPRDLETICLSCMAKEIALRYPTAQKVVDDLRRYLAGEPIGKKRRGLVERGLKWARRKPTTVAAYGLTLLTIFLSGLTAGIGRLWYQSETSRWAAEVAKQDAETARDGEEKAKGELAKLSYTQAVDLAHREYYSGNLDRARDLLDSCPRNLRGWEWRYVYRLCHSELVTLQGSGGYAGAITLDGTRIVILTPAGHVSIREMATGTELRTLTPGPSVPIRVSCTSDGRKVLTTSLDEKAARIWDAATGKQSVVLGEHTDRVFGAAFSADGSRVISSGFDGCDYVWSCDSGFLLLTLKTRLGPRGAAPSFSRDGLRILTTIDAMEAATYDASTGARLVSFKGHTKYLNSVIMSDDGRHVLTSSADGYANIWDASTGRVITSLRHNEEVVFAGFSPDATRVVTGCADGVARLWDTVSGSELRAIQCHSGRIMAVCFTPDGKKIVTSGADGMTRVWDANVRIDGMELQVAAHRDYLIKAGLSHDGSIAVTTVPREDEAALVKPVQFWDTKTGALLQSLDDESFSGNEAILIAISPNGSEVILGKHLQSMGIWNLERCNRRLAIPCTTNSAVKSIAYDATGRFVVTTSDDRSVRVWSTGNGVEVKLIRGAQGWIPVKATIAPGGSRIAVILSTGALSVLDGITGEELYIIREANHMITDASFSPDGRSLATGSTGKTISLWNTENGSRGIILRGHLESVRTVAFSPDGSRVLSASDDRSVRLWDVAASTCVLTLKCDKRDVFSAQFSGAGTKILAVCSQGHVRIWDSFSKLE